MLTTFVTSAARSVAAFEPDDDFFARFDVEEDVFFTRLDVEDDAFLPVSARFGIRRDTSKCGEEVSVATRKKNSARKDYVRTTDG